jgi:hypothetical protein
VRVVLSVGASWAGKRGAGVGAGRRGLSRLGRALGPSGLGRVRGFWVFWVLGFALFYF